MLEIFRRLFPNEREYQLHLPEDLVDHVREIANFYQTTDLEVFKAFIKLGFMTFEATERQNGKLILYSSDGRHRDIQLL